MISRCVISHVCVCTFVCVCTCVYTALNRIQSLNPYKFGTPLYHTLSPVHNIRSSERCNWKCIQNDLDVRCNVCICWNRNYFYSAYLTRVQIILYALPVAQHDAGKLRYAHSSVYCEPTFILPWQGHQQSKLE